MPRMIGGDDILARGVDDFRALRPILGNSENAHASNATLRKDEWEMIDERVNDVLRERLTIVDDLIAAGLTTSVSIGTLLRVTERLSDFDEADISFDGDTDPTEDRPNYERDVRPIPVIAKGFRVNWRQLAASRERGDPLDTTAAELAARKVRDKMQDLVTNGLNAGGPTGGGIPGILTAPDRLTVDLATGWGQSGATPVDDVLRMLDTAYQSNLFGPFTLYLPKNWWAPIQDDYSTQKGDRTILQRILDLPDIARVRPNDAHPNDEAAMIQMSRDVLDLSMAQAPTTVQWEKNPFVTNFRVLTVMGPHIKSIETDLGTTINGIVHLRASV